MYNNSLTRADLISQLQQDRPDIDWPTQSTRYEDYLRENDVQYVEAETDAILAGFLKDSIPWFEIESCNSVWEQQVEAGHNVRLADWRPL